MLLESTRPPSVAFANNLKPALAELEKVWDEAHQAEYGIWDTMSMHVRLLDRWRTRLMLKQAIAEIEGKPYISRYRGCMKGSFRGSAQDYMNNAEGVYPYFCKHSDRGLVYWKTRNGTLRIASTMSMVKWKKGYE